MEKDEIANSSHASPETPIAAPRPVPTVPTDRPPVPAVPRGTAGTGPSTPVTSAPASPVSAANTPGQPLRMLSSPPAGSQGLPSTRPTSFAGITRPNALPTAGIEKVAMPAVAALLGADAPPTSSEEPPGEIAATAAVDTSPASPSARMAKTPMQLLAENAAKRAAIVDDLRKKDVRGAILAGRRYIKAAETDATKAADLQTMYDNAPDRDKGAIEVACRRVPGFLKTGN